MKKLSNTKNGNKQIYVIRKYVTASSALEAIRKEGVVSVHDCYLEDNAQKKIIDKMYEKEETRIGF